MDSVLYDVWYYISTFALFWILLSVGMTGGTWMTAKVIKGLFPHWWQSHVVGAYSSDYFDDSDY